MEIVNVFNVADAVTGNTLDEEVEATLSVTAALLAPDSVGRMINPALLSEIGAGSSEYVPSYISTVDTVSPLVRALVIDWQGRSDHPHVDASVTTEPTYRVD